LVSFVSAECGGYQGKGVNLLVALLTSRTFLYTAIDCKTSTCYRVCKQHTRDTRVHISS
jgi:hypothetical protein